MSFNENMSDGVAPFKKSENEAEYHEKTLIMINAIIECITDDAEARREIDHILNMRFRGQRI